MYTIDMEATTTDQELFTWEAQHANVGGWKNQQIRDHFGIAPARFYQRVLRFAATAEALELDPFTARRLTAQAA